MRLRLLLDLGSLHPARVGAPATSDVEH